MPVDRRVKYTKKVLRETLIDLLKTKPISRITIKELCEHADINRSTFYSHYQDQYDLLDTIEKELIADINSYLDSVSIDSGESGLLQAVIKIVEYIDKNRTLCKVLLDKNANVTLQANIMQIVRERVVFEWQKKKSVSDAVAECIYTYVATGSIGVIRKWLLGSGPESPREIAGLITRLAHRGVDSFI